MATKTAVKPGKLVVCEQCGHTIDGESLDRHQIEDCNKVDEQTSGHTNTPKRNSVEDKLENLHEEFTMKLQEQQGIMEQRLQEQQGILGQRLQEREQRLQEQEQTLQEQQNENRNNKTYGSSM